jgi:hypothetical protein
VSQVRHFMFLFIVFTCEGHIGQMLPRLLSVDAAISLWSVGLNFL